jgi:hypothetical protein
MSGFVFVPRTASFALMRQPCRVSVSISKGKGKNLLIFSKSGALRVHPQHTPKCPHVEYSFITCLQLVDRFVSRLLFVQNNEF